MSHRAILNQVAGGAEIIYGWHGFSSYKDMIMHLLFPQSCPVCGKLGTSGCPECIFSMVAPLLPRCSLCGKPYPCSTHRSVFPLFSGNYHEGVNREIVLELKYRNKAGLGRIMGMALSSSVKDICADILVPVPLHRRSLRNYNQAKLIADGISIKTGKPVEDILSWNMDVRSQVSRSPSERRQLSPDLMNCRKPVLDGKKVILVDDVATTGTTLQICSLAIKRAGGKVTAAVTWTVSPF